MFMNAFIHVSTILVGSGICAGLAAFIFKRFISRLKMQYDSQMLVMVPIFLVIMFAYGWALLAIWNAFGLIAK
jgi:Kef-type K+ transport system membrane component KefB